MSSYEARLAAFSEGRRLLRLRHLVKNRDNVPCDACGSTEPRLLHVLKDEGADQFFFAGSNCLRALAELGLIRRRYAQGLAEQVYEQELARRQAEQDKPERTLELQDDDTTASPSSWPEAAGTSPVLIAAVAVLQPDEWARFLDALQLGADRWRFIVVGDRETSMSDLLNVGAHRLDLRI